jgi:hypothetical protein
MDHNFWGQRDKQQQQQKDGSSSGLSVLDT